MARRKSKYKYKSGRVHHLVLWKYDAEGNVLYSESDLRAIMEKKKQQYSTMSIALHDSDVYDADAVDNQNENRRLVYLRELILLSEMNGLAEDETTESGFVYSEAIDEEAQKRALRLFREIKVNDEKPVHWHIVITFVQSRNVLEVANWFKADASRDEIKTGRGAAESAWKYLIHYNHPLKHQYQKENVISSFDFTQEITALIEKQRRAEEMNPTKEEVEDYVDAIYNGRKLSDIPYNVYNKFKRRFDDARADYIYKKAPVRYPREIYYIDTISKTSDGVCISGVGKSVASREFAMRCASKFGAPNSMEFDEMCQNGFIFNAGSPEVLWSGYDGQPIVLMNEITAEGLIRGCGSIAMVKELLDMFPTKKKFNVKYGSVCPIPSVVIFNGAFQFEKFKSELKEADKGDASQYDRRFWANLRISNLQGDEMQVLINDYLLRTPDAPKEKMSPLYSIGIDWGNVALRYGGEAKARISEHVFSPLMQLREGVPERFKEEEKIIDADAVDIADLSEAVIFEMASEKTVPDDIIRDRIKKNPRKEIARLQNLLKDKGLICGTRDNIEKLFKVAEGVIKLRFGLIDEIPENPFNDVFDMMLDKIIAEELGRG